jgi:hydrogenase maturation protease
VKPRVLVAGIGNIFLGDDGFGVEVIRRLAGRAMPEGVRVADFGIRSFDLAYALMEGYELDILVDAMPHGEAPGTVYVMEIDPQVGDSGSGSAFDPHAMNPQQALRMVAAYGGQCGRLLMVGCEPEPPAEGSQERTGLSTKVRAAVDEAIAAIDRLIAEFFSLKPQGRSTARLGGS